MDSKLYDELIETFGYTISLTNTISVKTYTFAGLFSNAKALTYDELLRVENDNNYGYEKYIKEWKEKGILD